ncbi:hypothetical protein [uncultured Rikenella sp.]|uniref:hypothetical protein n=1 Tax=uncultured Rikenella sp. TaxID=368003 RepID=UPI0026134FE4|nr:hypothetical protein [uncultured Rikenella sp.]
MITILRIFRFCVLVQMGQCPAPGCRERSNGALGVVGSNGISWASTVSHTNGMNVNFSVMWLRSSTSDSRAYGFQLRCLSE